MYEKIQIKSINQYYITVFFFYIHAKDPGSPLTFKICMVLLKNANKTFYAFFHKFCFVAWK